MATLTIVGGVYGERCIQPAWDAVFGSAGRAAQAVEGLVDEPVELVTYVAADATSSVRTWPIAAARLSSHIRRRRS